MQMLSLYGFTWKSHYFLVVRQDLSCSFSCANPGVKREAGIESLRPRQRRIGGSAAAKCPGALSPAPRGEIRR
jgi:hypothetical protein